MNACELTFAVNALANTIAQCLSDDELGLLGSILSQLGDTLTTISIQRGFCNPKQLSPQSTDNNKN